MIHDLVLPQLAMGMSEGTIVEWTIPEGALVEHEAPLLSIETEKVTTELPSPRRGWVHHRATPGDKLPIETLIAQIADTEEEYRQLVGGAQATASTPVAAQPTTPEASRANQSEPAMSSPRAPTSAAPAAPIAPAPPTVPTARRIKVSGLARKIAADHGIDLGAIRGTGPEGRIVCRDLYQGGASATTGSASSAAADGDGMRARARVPMTGMRRLIAERMVTAKTTAAHTYAFFEVDLTKLADFRAALAAREKSLGGRVSMISLYAKALSVACRRVPICNATVENDEIVAWDNVNIGIAVALPGKTECESGLVVPVVRSVESKGIVELDREIKDVVDRAREGRLTSADMGRGTVTLSSTGGFLAGQWCVSTPLLNQPQVLNFQPGTPLKKPVVIDDEVVVRNMLPCGLSFDHRAMDGEPIGRFIHTLSDFLTNPEMMLL